MKRAGIAELKNRLSYYLRFVRRGQSVLVCDRDVPIARIDPIRRASDSTSETHLDELMRVGALRSPSAPLPSNWRDDRPTFAANVLASLLREREEGR